jgi:poly(hydroxyalkanoate) depolymerase family esterase
MRPALLLVLCAGCAAAADGGGADPDARPPADARPFADAIPWIDAGGGGGSADAEPSGAPAVCSTGSVGALETITCVPPGMEGKTGAPAPLVLVLHGYTQDPAGLLDSTEWDVLAGAGRFYVVFPRSGPGFRAWYWYTSGRSRGQSDPAALVAVVDAMKQAHDIDPDRIYVAGFSAGGYMAASLLADYPDVFAAGSVTSGGAHGCGVLCPSVPGPGGGAAAVTAELPSWWNDPGARKPRLMILHGDLDQTNLPGNADQLATQWLGALGADAQPDNQALGLPAELHGYPYAVYEKDGEVVVATVRLTDLGHGTPVDPGPGPAQGGHDPDPSKTADNCYSCPQDWTNTGDLYGAYHEAVFFGLL